MHIFSRFFLKVVKSVHEVYGKVCGWFHEGRINFWEILILKNKIMALPDVH